MATASRHPQHLQRAFAGWRAVETRGGHHAQELRELRLGETLNGLAIPGVRHGAGRHAGGKMRVSASSGDSWGNA
jgi:hypothetical protein